MDIYVHRRYATGLIYPDACSRWRWYSERGYIDCGSSCLPCYLQIDEESKLAQYFEE